MNSVEDLIELLPPPGKDDDRVHRPPWTWHALSPGERAVLEELTNNWVDTYNRTLATSISELVPPCWLLHEGLATELPVMLWDWYLVHRSQSAHVGAAAEFYTRILPAFRGRVDRYLGDAAEDCRSGRHPEHPDNWRAEIDKVIDSWPTAGYDTADRADVMAELHSAFGPATS